MRNRRIRFLSQQSGGSQFCRGRRGLDAESALTRAPEESRYVRVESVNRQAVRREAPETCPATLDALHRPVDHLLEPVDGSCDIDLVRRRVARLAGDFVVRT